MNTDYVALIEQGCSVSIGVAGVLLAMSVTSWSLMLVKSIRIRLLKRKNAQFKALLTARHEPSAMAGLRFDPPDLASSDYDETCIRTAVTAYADMNAGLAESPYARLACQAFAASQRLCRYGEQNPEAGREQKELIASSLRQTLNNESVGLENGLTALASIGSLAPFVGLFGTVWGIYHALGAIALNGQATVDKVAGPVGEALIMTAFGLGVAMPAVLAYNAFVRDNRLFLADLENFAHQLYVGLAVSHPQPSKTSAKSPASKAALEVA